LALSRSAAAREKASSPLSAAAAFETPVLLGAGSTRNPVRFFAGGGAGAAAGSSFGSEGRARFWPRPASTASGAVDKAALAVEDAGAPPPFAALSGALSLSCCALRETTTVGACSDEEKPAEGLAE
jgi:hypothetical protein